MTKPSSSTLLRCSFSDGPFLLDSETDSAVQLVVRDQAAGTFVYVSDGIELRRYRLRDAAIECVLERDGTFGAAGKVGVRSGSFAIDHQGTVWLSSNAHLKRVVPAPSMPCTVGPGYVDKDGSELFSVGALLLDEDGAGGWGLDGPDDQRGRLTLGPGACSVTLAPAPLNVQVRATTPRDALGRLHVLDAPAPGLVGIYADDGSLVSSYAAASTIDLTRCAGGICALTSTTAATSVVYGDDRGVARAAPRAAITDLHMLRIAADATGPVFLGGASIASVEPLHQIIVELAPAPP